MVASLIGLSTRLVREQASDAQAVAELRAAATMGGMVRTDLLAQACGYHHAKAARGWPEDGDSPRAAELLAAAGGTDREIIASEMERADEAFKKRGR